MSDSATRDGAAGGEVTAKEAMEQAAERWSTSLQASPAAQKQVDAAHAVTDAAMARIAEIEQYLEATGAEVDSMAGGAVPELQKHTEQLTNVFALIDKMHEHIGAVKASVDGMEQRLQAAEAANAGQLAKTWGSLMGKQAVAAPKEAVKIVSVDQFFASLKV